MTGVVRDGGDDAKDEDIDCAIDSAENKNIDVTEKWDAFIIRKRDSITIKYPS